MGFVNKTGPRYSLAEKADLVKSYHVLSGEIPYPANNSRIRAMNVNKDSVAEYRTPEGETGPVGVGSPIWFPLRKGPGTIWFRKMQGTPVLDLTRHRDPEPSSKNTCYEP